MSLFLLSIGDCFCGTGSRFRRGGWGDSWLGRKWRRYWRRSCCWKHDYTVVWWDEEISLRTSLRGWQSVLRVDGSSSRRGDALGPPPHKFPSVLSGFHRSRPVDAIWGYRVTLIDYTRRSNVGYDVNWWDGKFLQDHMTKNRKPRVEYLNLNLSFLFESYS